MAAHIKKIAFYAPLKSPDHPVPSGDREIARLFMSALRKAAFDVDIASHFRSLDKVGDPQRQMRLIHLAEKIANRILAKWQSINYKPDAWFCYHLYYKAPDLIGPIICAKLNIPYIAAEASWAPKRANGRWALYHQKLHQALHQSNKVICINPVDIEALQVLFGQNNTDRLCYLPAFIDDQPKLDPAITKQTIANQFKLNLQCPWLITVAMMRDGDKFSSYKYLAAVMANHTQNCELVIIGDGVMRAQIESLFSAHANVHFTGHMDNPDIKQFLPYFDLLIWPAINEALGMVFLEAQQAGVPVLAGNQGGVSSLVKHHDSGVLVDIGKPEIMAESLKELLNSPLLVKQYQQATSKNIEQNHSISATARKLTDIIQHTGIRLAP